jgi:8-oxo-dGTP diphosphatase
MSRTSRFPVSDSREYPARPIPGVGVIVRNGDRVLLIQRGKPPGLGTWGIPGGAVELGEAWRETAMREVREECGIEIALGEIVEAVDLIFRDDAGKIVYHYAVVDFAAQYVGGELCAASDVMDARWVELSELIKYEMPRVTRKVIAKTFGVGGAQ